MRESAVPYFIMALSITEVASSLELGMLSILPREKDHAKLIYGERSTFSSSSIKLAPLTINIHQLRFASFCETRDFGTRSTQHALISRVKSIASYGILPRATIWNSIASFSVEKRKWTDAMFSSYDE